MLKKLFGTTILSLALSFGLTLGVQAATYEVDPGHSTIGFAVKHLQVGTTRGGFKDYSGTVNYNPKDYVGFSADVTIQAASIDTGVEARDKHLRSDDFLGTESHPTIAFNNARLEKRGGGTVIIGDLTIKGVTKTVTIPVTISGPVVGMQGVEVIGIAGQTSINRQDFGVSWSKILDSGGLVVDDSVTLVIEIEAHQKS